MGETDVIFVREGIAPAPSKDYFYLTINKSKKLTLRSWNINLRTGTNRLPLQSTSSFQEFLEAKSLQSEIVRVFGVETLEHVKGALSGSSNTTFGDLPENVMKKICLELDLCEIGRLGQTCKQLRSICHSDDLWFQLYQRYNEYVSPEIKDVAKIIGWRTIFISSALHLRRFKNTFDTKSFI